MTGPLDKTGSIPRLLVTKGINKVTLNKIYENLCKKVFNDLHLDQFRKSKRYVLICIDHIYPTCAVCPIPENHGIETNLNKCFLLKRCCTVCMDITWMSAD